MGPVKYAVTQLNTPFGSSAMRIQRVKLLLRKFHGLKWIKLNGPSEIRYAVIVINFTG